MECDISQIEGDCILDALDVLCDGDIDQLPPGLQKFFILLNETQCGTIHLNIGA